MSAAANAQAVRELADQCVMCGLCLPHCPTYALAQDEAESPRGRIALAKAVATEAIPISTSVFAHLDQCLACRACETACPSNVQYEQLLIQTRALIEPARQRRSLMHRLAAHPRLLARLAELANFTAASRWVPTLARALPLTSSLRRLLTSLPPAPHAFRTMRIAVPAAPAGDAAKTIALFDGCVASAFDRDTLAATRMLLERLGHRVVSPTGTFCCGALPRHAGHSVATAKAVAQTRSTFLALDAEEVAVSASGCFSALAAALRCGELDEGIRVVDAAQRIAQDSALAKLRFRPLAQHAALHLPCSQVNGAKSVEATRALLARIPGLTIIDLPTSPRCCGAAGSYYLEHPDIADRLRDQRLDQIDSQPVDVLLTSNVGCRIHLGNGLRQRGRELPTLHPLTLLAQQLEHP